MLQLSSRSSCKLFVPKCKYRLFIIRTKTDLRDCVVCILHVYRVVDMSFECLVFGSAPVLYIDQKISNGFALILLRGFAHENLPLTQLCAAALNSSTYRCNLGCSCWCERPSLESFTCADFQWFLIMTSELKKTKKSWLLQLHFGEIIRGYHGDMLFIKHVINSWIFRGKPLANPFWRID